MNSLRGFNLILISLSFLIIILWPMILIFYLFHQLYLLINIFWLVPLFAYAGLLSYGALFLIQTYVILKVLFNPKVKTGTYDIANPNPAIIYYAASSIFIAVIEKIFETLLVPQTFYANFVFKIFAKYAGKGSLINPIPDPYLVSIGIASAIGRGVLIVGHEISGTRIILKEVKIGNRVTIAPMQ